jgi:hypothetical protein
MKLIKENMGPLIVGWTPTRTKLELIQQGRENELPGYWLYRLQIDGAKPLRKICGHLFGVIYASRKV